MANPYKKAEQVKKVAPGARPEPPVIEKKEEVKPVEIPEVIVPVEETPAPVAPVVKDKPKARGKRKKSVPGKIEQKEEKKTFGFYLPVAMVNELEEIATDNNINISTLVKAILQDYLDGDE